MDREQLQAEERQLVADRRQKENYLGLLEVMPGGSRMADLVDQEREKLRAIEERLHRVRLALEWMPAAAPPAVPTHS